MGSFLCIDYGERRMGIAFGRSDTGMAFPRPAIDRKRVADPVDAVLQLMKSEGANTLIIGWPEYPDGSENEMTRRVDLFAKKLEQKTGKAVIRVSEVWSSIEAKEKTQHYSRKKKREKGRIDSAAATLVLQKYLDGEEN